MIVVHHLENSRSQRVLWLLEELGLPYELKRYARDPKTMLAPPALRAVHPLGKSPVVVDGDMVLAESGAIVEVLLETHGQGRLVPARGSEAWRQYVYWLHFAEGSGMPPLLMKLVFDRIRSAPMPFFVKPIARGIADKVTNTFIAPNLQRQFDFIEAHLAAQPWFAGAEFSAADIQMSFVLEAGSARGGAAADRPRIDEWLARIHARPAYRRALERGGPYTIIG